MTERAVAPELPREGQRRAVPINARSSPASISASAMDTLEEHRGDAARRLDMGIRYLGEAAALNETSSGVAITFGFALVVVLLVLAAQFESFVSAIIIMFTVPFGLAAAIFAIALSGGSINIYSQIGLVMLVGIMSKNGILIVEFANQLRERGFRVEDAIREACRIRLRPVVMTMIATVAGGVPLVIMGGAGAEARQALGWIVVGGLGFATIITLFVTPVAFLLLARFSKPRSAEAERLDTELGEVAGADLRRWRSARAALSGGGGVARCTAAPAIHVPADRPDLPRQVRRCGLRGHLEAMDDAGRRRHLNLSRAHSALGSGRRPAPSTGCPLARTAEDETQAARNSAEIRAIAAGDQPRSRG